jgi:polysaccharide export outer membrane protein
MRPGRLFVAMLGALVVAGCGHAPIATEPGEAMAAFARAPDLDTLIYARGEPRAGVTAPSVDRSMSLPAVMPAYSLDSGDRLRIVVFGQEGLTNSYLVDAGGNITMPLIGKVAARGATAEALSRAIVAQLRNGFIREPHVAIEVEAYRPFFILGEVTYPGQYPYVPGMTIEAAIAIAGGFTPRASRELVGVARKSGRGATRTEIPLLDPVRPGDTITVRERWF